jgi:hypothetical protein
MGRIRLILVNKCPYATEGPRRREDNRPSTQQSLANHPDRAIAEIDLSRRTAYWAGIHTG